MYDLDTQTNNNSNDTLISHKASSITTNDQTYVKSHYIDLTTQTESSISVSTYNTKIQHDGKTASQPSTSKSDKQTLNIIPSNKVHS